MVAPTTGAAAERSATKCTRVDSRRYLAVEIMVPPSGNAKAFFEMSKTRAVPGEPHIDIADVGEGAFRADMKTESGTLTYVFVLKGNRVVMLTVSGFNDSDVIALAKAITRQL